MLLSFGLGITVVVTVFVTFEPFDSVNAENNWAILIAPIPTIIVCAIQYVVIGNYHPLHLFSKDTKEKNNTI